MAVAISVPVAMTVGCSRNEEKATVSQVAAQVNADEITVHQVNAVLAGTPNVVAEDASRVKRQILERLIDQQLAVQQAYRRKLDRSPEVLQALEAARAEILARAFAAQIARTQERPSPEEINSYYAQHPELFAQRRLYLLEELSILVPDDSIGGLAEIVHKARSMQEVGAWLRSKNAKFGENRGMRAAEQIPLEMLPSVHAMREGELQVIKSAGRTHVVRLVAAKASPLDEAAAGPRIEQFLANRRAQEALAKEMKQVKEAAKIQYRGEFAAASSGTAEVATK
jgi:EpsD family peptidyl-prolyl cis-trans isomerase